MCDIGKPENKAELVDTEQNQAGEQMEPRWGDTSPAQYSVTLDLFYSQ